LSCTASYIGGSGDSEDGAPCVKGECNDACVACFDTSFYNCYICSAGFYDPMGDPTSATPCYKCHESCLSCGPTRDAGTLKAESDENGCYACAPGWFDI